MSCPTERNALNEFYSSAQGNEWVVDINWAKPYIGHCDWYGVTCNDANNTIKLKLPSNGLSGTLTNHLAKLHSLEVLELNNNNIKVRLSYLDTFKYVRQCISYSNMLCFFLNLTN